MLPIRRRPSYCPKRDLYERGIFHITLVTKRRGRVLGTTYGPHYCRTPMGIMVEQAWDHLPYIYPFIRTGTCVAMPDHFHGLIRVLPHTQNIPLSRIVAHFKGTTSRRSTRHGHPKGRPLWQRSYWDVRVHTPDHLRRTQRYIRRNPAKWMRKCAWR